MIVTVFAVQNCFDQLLDPSDTREDLGTRFYYCVSVILVQGVQTMITQPFVLIRRFVIEKIDFDYPPSGFNFDGFKAVFLHNEVTNEKIVLRIFYLSFSVELSTRLILTYR